MFVRLSSKRASHRTSSQTVHERSVLMNGSNIPQTSKSQENSLKNEIKLLYKSITTINQSF
ncbi:hypothetical protein HanXRQr2_Chr17g0817981 [Helianthus annuus]|uniref:Uncharacterized protein n=1 Tax=Helianthus annuus TaxID=4232 RepID=A0A9K3DLA1_HELAN|nr:hypothetical protein HanXRQr2_Chr17g0817981 [Helianthus annuus]